ncbi:LamG domain-containing protein [Lentzea sp. BCCO 10_0798]|uniref:LamG domain-containing protein n=1 Tax=Lentzea kristufekii TaxID=3095430 RepID=A0ABU4TST4_9PSEU|nr:LamG domain-containing protein [Lentzea sp. BCCO 10_0798]MDX8051255.1 LamG domain-containing protein [Lentzea sp. BCCO 10_0798]
MRHKPARGFRLPALVLALAVSAGFATPVAHAAEVPEAPQVSSLTYPPAPHPGGGVGVAGAFELQANDVVKFVYSFSHDSGESLDNEVAADADGKATIQWTPRASGVQQLFARSVNSAGQYSAQQRYEFFVLPGAGAVAHWALDYTWVDTNGRNPLTSNGFVDGHVLGHGNRAVAFPGRQDYLSGAAPIDTSKNFTVSAWAKVDDAARARGIVALDDSAGLYFDSAAGRWAFGMSAAADKTAPRVALSRDAALIGVWTHLTGTYESTSATLALHVDGVKQAEVTGVEGWQAARLLVGGNGWNSANLDGARTIDDVRVHQRTLNDAEVKRVASAAGLRSHYKLNGSGGFTPDEVTGTSSAIGPGVDWEEDGDDRSLRFNGDSYVSLRGPRIRTDRSFSVSAWARLDLDAREGDDRTFVSLVHNNTSLLDLRYGGASKTWEFVIDGTTVKTAYGAELQEWTYLTAVHDKLNSEIRLYFNGIYVTKASFTGGSAQTESDLELGRRASTGGADSFWKGGIDDVRVYAGVLSEEQILAQAVRA